MRADEASTLFPIFAGVWAILGVASACFFLFTKDVQRKRWALPRMAFATGLLFAGFLLTMDLPPQALLIAVPMIALISYLNIRMTNFCDSCGAMLVSHNPFSKPAFCSKCGNRLANHT